MTTPSFTGGCLCGATRFRVDGTPTNRCYCHCRSCRLASGAPFVAWATFPTSGFEVVRGQAAQHASSPEVTRGFCAACGTTISYQHQDRPGELDVALAVLDDAGDIPPECHIWASQKLPWVVLEDGLPRFDEWPDTSA